MLPLTDMTEIAAAFVAALQPILPQGITLPSLLLIVACGYLPMGLALLLGIVSLTTTKRRLREAEAASAFGKTQEIRVAELAILLESERRHAAEKLQFLEDAREELSLRFAGLAQQIFDEKSARFGEQNKERLEAILEPFNHQLIALKQEINEIYRNDSRERLSLKAEILQLRDLNQQINQEAINLTRALKNDTKVQGNWGELILNRVLERSGLRHGHEYETQGGFRDPHNRLLKPDVIIHLPEGRDIIVDSKVSLISWERYVNCEEEKEREGLMGQLVQAVRDHLATLGRKSYQDVSGVRSLDFVLMFMPIEAAFAAVLQHDDTLCTEALDHNVIIVTPTTLLATLRTIENLWHFEHQNRNSLEIARRAGLMYDKFRNFVEEMERIGRQLATCQTTYEGAFLKLTRGRGNLVAQSEQLKELGVQIKKEMPKGVLDISELDLKN